MYDKEPQFEHDLISFLFDYGWSDKVIKYPTEEDQDEIFTADGRGIKARVVENYLEMKIEN